MNRRRYDPSVDRRKLGRLVKELDSILESFTDDRLLVRGGFQILRRRCGKENCRCRNGQLHETRVFVQQQDGNRTLRKATGALESDLKKPVNRYRKIRRLRARLTKLHLEILASCDRLVAMRLKEGTRVLSRRRSR